ncbi:MAG: lactoylglutathione lyase [Clostridiaceae bacterium]|nr:lactoylglutathione lyase [Clostridiaceae bacterium]
MKFEIAHCNINVQDLDRAIAFYEEALGLRVVRKHEVPDSSFILVFLTDESGEFQIELTWLRDHADRPYDLGENESHICFRTDDYEAAHAHHKAMDCICYENPGMGLYFICDPDGYWLEIVPVRR